MNQLSNFLLGAATSPPPQTTEPTRRGSQLCGVQTPGSRVHRAIANLTHGDLLQVRENSSRWQLLDENGTVVGQLASNFKVPYGMRLTHGTVMAIAAWDRQSSEPQFQPSLRSDEWEVVVPELVFQPET